MPPDFFSRFYIKCCKETLLVIAKVNIEPIITYEGRGSHTPIWMRAFAKLRAMVDCPKSSPRLGVPSGKNTVYSHGEQTKMRGLQPSRIRIKIVIENHALSG